MENISKDRKPFGTRWKLTEGSLPVGESGDEPEDEADNGNRNKEVNRAVTANAEYPNKTRQRMLSTHWDVNGRDEHILTHPFITFCTESRGNYCKVRNIECRCPAKCQFFTQAKRP